MKKTTKDQSAKSGNYHRITNLIEETTKENLRFVSIPLELFEYAEETQKAVFLARLIYLSDKGKKANGFIWKSFPEWQSEIGLSQYQVERIVKDFQGRGILEAKKMMAGSKNGNASYTWHYRLLMNKFVSNFRKFLRGRTTINLQLEPEETCGSITDITNIKTSDNTLYEENNSVQYEIQEEEENQNVIEENSKQESEEESSQEESYADDSLTSDLESDDLPSSTSGLRPVSLPDDFEPSLENKVWAIRNYPGKSLKQITDKFCRYFSTKENVIRDSEGWQMEWRNWVETHMQFGINQEVVQEEHWKIENELLNVVWDFFNEPTHDFKSRKHTFFIVPQLAIDQYFCEDRSFDKTGIDESVNHLLQQDALAKYFQYYYNSELYEEDPQWAEKVDRQMFSFASQMAECKEIFAFVRKSLIVKIEDVYEAFSNTSKDSINNLFRVCLAYNKFSLISGYYYENIGEWADSIEDENYSIAVNKRLAELGLAELWKDNDEDSVETEETDRESIASGSGVETDEFQTSDSEANPEEVTGEIVFPETGAKDNFYDSEQNYSAADCDGDVKNAELLDETEST